MFLFVTDNRSNYGATPNTFVFFLRKKEGVQPFKGVISNPHFAIFNWDKDAGLRFDDWDNLDLLNSFYKPEGTEKSSRSKLSEPTDYEVPDNVQSAIGRDWMYFEPDEVEAFYLD